MALFLRVNTRDGSTARLDIQDAEQAAKFLKLQRDPQWQTDVTGLVAVTRARVTGDEVQTAVVRPVGFGSVTWCVEDVPSERANKGGNRIVVTADGVRLTVMVHRDRHAARVEVSRC